MDEFRDPGDAARPAIWLVSVYLAAALLGAGSRYLDRETGDIAGLISLAEFVVAIACYVLVGRWIYRTNANAHALGTGEMSITPGWSVGWFFVPFANLVMPYRGVRESWEVSHRMAGLDEFQDRALLGWWWGLWIGTNIISTIAARIAGWDAFPPEEFYYFDLTAALLNAPLCLVLIRLMRKLTEAQQQARRYEVFA